MLELDGNLFTRFDVGACAKENQSLLRDRHAADLYRCRGQSSSAADIYRRFGYPRVNLHNSALAPAM